LVSLFGLDHDVIHVSLNGSPDEVLETLEHTMLFRPNGIVIMQNDPNRVIKEVMS
jgi:hypothetical protein